MPSVCPNPVPRRRNDACGFESPSCGQNAVFEIVFFGACVNGNEEELDVLVLEALTCTLER